MKHREPVAISLANGQYLFIDVGLSDADGPYPDGASVRVYVGDALQALVRVKDGRLRWQFRAASSGEYRVRLEVDTVDGLRCMAPFSIGELGRYEFRVTPCLVDARGPRESG